MVGKCDMCHGRLSMGDAPACVSACPEGAIAIEIVDVAEWREALAARRALDGTADDSSISTTRVSGTASLPPNAKPRDLTHVRPEHPHWPLVVMTVLTQLSVGAFATVWLLHMLGALPAWGSRPSRRSSSADWPWARPRCTWAARCTPIAPSACGAARG